MATAPYVVKDKGRVLEFSGKSLEGRSGARTQLATPNELFIHFNAPTTIPAGLTLSEGGTPVTAAAYGTGLGGVATLTSDDVAAAHETLLMQLLWQCDRQPAGQPLVFESKWKAGTTITTVEYWVGFDDTITPGDSVALSATSTFTTSEPTDAAVMGFSTTPTSGAAFTAGGNEIVAIGINNDTNTIVGKTGTVFAASTYYTCRIELSAAGDAAYFLDDQFKLASGAAVRATVPLNGYAQVIPRATAGGAERIMTIDYIYVGGV